MALNPARRQAFGLTPDEEDEIIARAARDIAAPSDDDLPVIDLGDEAEVFIPHEVPAPEPMPADPFQSQARGVALRRPSPTSSVQRAPEPGSFAAASPVVDEPVDDRFDVLGRPLTITSGTGIVPGLADDDEEDPGEPLGAAPASSTATPSPDDEPIGPEPQMAVRPEQPIERVAPLRKRYGTTPDDVVALGRAADQDRRRRIGRGILGTVGALAGILGAATGRVGLGALGSTAFAGAGGLRPDRRQTLQSEIDARNDRLQAGDDAAAAASLAQRQMDLAEQRSAQEAANAARREALAERQAEADIALDEARAAQLQQEAGIEALNRAALEGDTEAQRNILRALVNGLNDNSPLADNLRAAVNDPSFHDASLGTLNQMQEDVTRLAATRHTQLITGGGGGRGRAQTVWDPSANGGQGAYVTVRSRGRSSAGAPAPAQPTALPRAASRVPSAERMPSVSGMPTVAPSDAAISPDTEVAWAEQVMRDAQWGDRTRREGMIRRLQTGRGSASHDTAVAELTQLAGRTERLREAGMPPDAVDIDPAEWQRMSASAQRQLTPLALSRQRALGFLGALRSWKTNRPTALRAALASLQDPESRSNFSPDVWAQGQDIVAQFRAYTNPILAQRSGAAVTNSEFRRLMQEFGAGTWAGDLGVASDAVDRQVSDWEMQIEQASADYHPIFVREWAQRHVR